MLQYVKKIDRVGVFNSLNGENFPFGDVTLIYAENGSGKSTLTSLLRAAGEQDADMVLKRKRLGAELAPFVVMQNRSGGSFRFANGDWRGPVPKCWVFDSEFVERNLHTGGVVSPKHRANLLEFAIGDSAVSFQNNLQEARTKVDGAKEELAAAELAIVTRASVLDPGITFEKFEKVEGKAPKEAKIEEAENLLSAGRNSDQIRRQPKLAELELPNLDFDQFSVVLETTLEKLHLRARDLVARHVEGLADPTEAREWILTGISLQREEKCPYCAQSLQSVDLIDSYRHFFDDSYTELRDKVTVITQVFGSEALSVICEQIHADYLNVLAARENWAVHVDVPVLPALEALDDAFAQLGRLIDPLIVKKNQKIEETGGTPAEIAEAKSQWRELQVELSRINASIGEVNLEVESFTSSIDRSNLEVLEEAVLEAKLAVLRESSEVKALFAEHERAQEESRNYQLIAKNARKSLKDAMEATLQNFQSEINFHLEELSASFKIIEVDSSFQGGGTRGTYALEVDGHKIDVTKTNPPFNQVLSEGDKRALGFAFFCVSVLAEDDLSGQTVIIDDPMTSLDTSRRTRTIEILQEMSLKGAQVVLLAHDAFFLRDLREAVVRQRKADGELLNLEIQEFCIQRDEQGSSVFAEFELDAECETSYQKNYRRIRCYLEGTEYEGGRVSHTDAGIAIRPLIEGHLHRRFYGRIPKNKKTLGSVINMIDDSSSDDVMVHTKPLVPTLERINRFASSYHHDDGTDGGQKPNRTEVTRIANLAFDIVHGAPLSQLR